MTFISLFPIFPTLEVPVASIRASDGVVSIVIVISSTAIAVVAVVIMAAVVSRC